MGRLTEQERQDLRRQRAAVEAEAIRLRELQEKLAARAEAQEEREAQPSEVESLRFAVRAAYTELEQVTGKKYLGPPDDASNQD